MLALRDFVHGQSLHRREGRLQSEDHRPINVSASHLQRGHTAALIHWCSFCLGAAPTWRAASLPPLNSIRVGMDMMPYCPAVFGFSSTLSFTIFTLSPS